MLETIRQYAHEKLVERGRLSRYASGTCSTISSGRKGSGEARGPEQAQLLDLLEAELDNLRLALEWSLESEDSRLGIEVGLRIASALLWFWHPRSRHNEGIEWLERLLVTEAQESGEEALTADRTARRAQQQSGGGRAAYCVGKILNQFRL